MIAEKFTSHPVFEKLDQLYQALISDSAKEKIPIADSAFLEAAYQYIRDCLKLTLPVLVQETELNNLSSEIDAATAQINAYLGNNNSAHITNAVNNFNSAFNRIKNFPFPLSKGDFDFAKAIAGFEQATKAGYDRLESVNVKLQQDLKVAQESLDTKQTLLTALEKKLANKETEIQNVLIRYNTEFEALKTKANTDIEVERKKFNDNIDTDRKLYKEQFDTDKESNAKTFEEQKLTFETQSKEVINGLNAKLAEANKIVNIVGNVGVTGNYQNIANQHNNSANFFRWVALGFMIVMSGLLIYSIIELSSGDFNLYKSLVRILAAAVLTYPAVYAARESTRHRNLETNNRNLELELASIGPFIELLPEDKKQKIKEDLVNKYFGRNNAVIEDKKDANEDLSVNGLEKILKTILPYIKK